MERLWEEASDVGEDDYIIAREDMEARRKIAALG
jgi:CTD kinase subunit gamma